MFDPTAFDNMKVVIEGALYDLDFMGLIKIVDRNDLINTAKMSRIFNMSFRLTENGDFPSTAKFEMEAGLINLASEILPNVVNNLSGCHISLEFVLERSSEFKDYPVIEAILEEIWGPSRKITQKVHYNPIRNNGQLIVILIDFERIIGEDQMDDLVAMMEVMTQTLEKLDQL